MDNTGLSGRLSQQCPTYITHHTTSQPHQVSLFWHFILSPVFAKFSNFTMLCVVSFEYRSDAVGDTSQSGKINYQDLRTSKHRATGRGREPWPRNSSKLSWRNSKAGSLSCQARFNWPFLFSKCCVECWDLRQSLVRTQKVKSVSAHSHILLSYNSPLVRSTSLTPHHSYAGIIQT